MDLKDFTPEQLGRMVIQPSHNTTQPAQSTAKKAKYRAEPCIVTVDLTLFTETDIRQIAEQRGTLPKSPMPLRQLAACYDIMGEYFRSTREGRRYVELARLQQAGEISRLELQPPYPMHVISPAGIVITIGTYRADFRYLDKLNRLHVEDVKSDPTRTEAYQLRKKHVEAQYLIVLEEV